jgi:hypothetical protein
VDSVTEKSRNAPTERRRQRTINLNINNFKISYKQLGQHVVQHDLQFNRGRPENYSHRLLENQPTLTTIGRDLADMDASRTLMMKLEEIQSRGKLHQRRNPPARLHMTTVSTFYDAQSGKMLQLRDLEPFSLPNPMDANYKPVEPWANRTYDQRKQGVI